MYLERAQVLGLGPFDHLDVDLCDRPTEPRLLTVVHGDGGTGKTTLLTTIAATRPTNHVVQSMVWRRPGVRAYAICDWRLGAEDPERPHPLAVVTPGFSATDDDQAEQLRRREVAHFDRVANESGGFCFVGLPGTRRYPRASLVIGDPARTVLRPDARGAPGFHDPNGVDMTRPIKLILAYASIAGALAPELGEPEPAGEPELELDDDAATPVADEPSSGAARSDHRVLGRALRAALDELLGLIGHRYRGLSPRTLEPLFEAPGGELLPFDGLAAQARQLVCLATIPAHQLWVSHRGADPRGCEGLIVIDDLELNLSERVQLELLASLRRCLPRAQWLVATASPTLAHAAPRGATLTLRREAGSARVTAYEGELSLTH